MLSRVAESVFWMNRYIERAENYARFIDVNHQLSLDLNEDFPNQWMPLVYTTGDAEVFEKKYESPTPASVIQFMTFDDENPSSIYNCVQRARENARSIRENISTPMWEVLNEFYLFIKDYRKQYLEHPESRGEGLSLGLSEFLSYVRKSCQTFYGTSDSTISHDEVWSFSLLGRFLERADKTTRILDMKYFILLPSIQDVGSTLDLLQWMSLLKSTSAHEMYNRKYKKVHPIEIAEFLVLDPAFPRSIVFCLHEIEESLEKVSGNKEGLPRNLAQDAVTTYLNRLRSENVHSVFDKGLHEYLDDIQIELNRIGAKILERFFKS
ncbi:alpha-E domain-containing protein [Leptospira ilyithenensis]|uniref:Alpha-E domain-containing protein n=1 Tax=Leptospira ilyithenensis TaxID=2484901 RepID=A0A4V3JXB4_9LEPT|nr:alpha-E domain-containing protein [Leptospira ilyithenensis]TGN10887.1 alpha-E domain-containing protein [Leptospira ilyithenensis]